MLVAEFLKLLEVNLIGQDTQRFVSRPRVTQATQSANHPLPATPHGYHQAPRDGDRLGWGGPGCPERVPVATRGQRDEVWRLGGTRFVAGSVRFAFLLGESDGEDLFGEWAP